MGKQTANKNALSTSEAEYISLYTALREVIPFVYLLLELSEVIGRFPAGSNIYIFGHLLKSDKLLVISLIKRYMTTVVYLTTA